MPNARRLRLHQVARELKVGQTTIIEFLEKKGVKVENSPSSIIEPAVYAILDKEFGGNKNIEKVNIREKIALKHEAVSLDTRKGSDGASEEESGFKSEVFVKSGVISVKDEVAAMSTPKILGKIDLSGGRSGRSSSSEKKPESPKKPAAASEASAPSAPAADAKPAELSQQPVQSTVAVAEQPAPSPRPEQPVTAPVVVQSQTYDERVAADQSNLFRPEEGARLSGPKVLGKIDVQSFEKKKGEDGHRRREKRKRITKDKVDITQKQNQTATARPDGRPKSQGGGPYSSQGGSQHGPKSGLRDRKKGKSVKPVVKTEISDEEVQKQIKDTLARLTSKGSKFKTAKHRRDKREAVSARLSEEMERQEQEKNVLKVTEFVTVSELATMMDVSVTDVITACMNLGLMVSINQRLDAEALVVVAEEFGFKVEFVAVEIQEAIDTEEDSEEDLVPRPPVVAVMGHVDHGKTSLLDNIRNANVIAGEAGGITQHIGAYSVKLDDGRRITFLDTPGHEAFTAMRARGAKVTDVAIIIVAADDNVMPQTVEAINHATAAGVPMVFAINKIDKPGANPEKIKEELSAMNYLVEDWGGKYQSQEISAKKGINLDKLLDKVLLEAEFLDLKANPNRKAQGVVIESTLDKGRGYVATVLVQNGTLRVGDVMLSGVYTGKVKAMFNERGTRVTEAPPSTPVLVLGLNGAPQAGDTFNVMDDERSARDIASKREQLQRMQGLRTQKHITLDEIGRRIAIGNFKELNIIIKGDVDGSIEAMADSLIKLSKDEVQVNVIHKAVGPISESDVLLAAASNAVIVGFQVRPSAAARKLAEKEEIEIRLYSIIYDAINDIKDAIEGMLAPVMKEEIVCSVEVMETFKITKVGTVAGCLVREGKITRNTNIRVIRDGIVVYTGKLGSLKRFKDDVKEVTTGLECGLNIENYNDVRVGDIIEGYEQVEVKRK
ncbi:MULTISPECIES: translation initiation factor IF-2 [Alistipes]|uniref:translation initiation factor IF-2 n=4 Tax=Rikenellaceae TaxID=171550 RepID=UPI001ED03757|nr:MULTISPECIES: translation initiation factor IF-2 [Alistipes]MBS1365027.1 translation initiation factor IF-2 [Alistipes sp.]